MTLRLTTVLVLAIALAACGGGDTPSPVSVQSFSAAPIGLASSQASADAKRFALAATASPAASSSPWGAAEPNDAIEQLLNFGEASYAVYFPKHTETLVYQQYRYRFYRDTGVYLGVADGTGGSVAGGVYVMGGPFGDVPTFVGALTGFVTPYAVLHYSDVIIANSDLYGWYPIKLVLTSGAIAGDVTFSAEKAVNATKFQVGVSPLFNCGFNRTKLKTGGVKLSCQDAVSKARHSLVWNPVTNQITEYDDSEGAYPALSDATWVFAQTDVAPVQEWSMFTETSSGWIWNSRTDWRTIHFKRKSDGKDTTLPLSIGLVKAFGGFSN